MLLDMFKTLVYIAAGLILIYAAGRAFGAGWFRSKTDHLRELAKRTRVRLTKQGDLNDR